MEKRKKIGLLFLAVIGITVSFDLGSPDTGDEKRKYRKFGK